MESQPLIFSSVDAIEAKLLRTQEETAQLEHPALYVFMTNKVWCHEVREVGIGCTIPLLDNSIILTYKLLATTTAATTMTVIYNGTNYLIKLCLMFRNLHTIDRMIGGNEMSASIT